MALRLAPNTQEAEDIVQDVMIKLWNMRERLEDVENLEAFALRMTRNLALDRQRMHINNTENIDDIEAERFAVTEQNDRKEQVESIRNVMMQLPEKQRSAMHLRDFEGYSYKEIATMLDMTEDQVKINIFRARQYVKTKLTSFN